MKNIENVDKSKKALGNIFSFYNQIGRRAGVEPLRVYRAKIKSILFFGAELWGDDPMGPLKIPKEFE